jgi:hypothetical protein
MDMDNDARYERPCKCVMAVAGGIHWVVAALILADREVEGEFISRYARVIQDAVNAILPAIG